ncbi:MAG TPA: hypothetical protein VHW93_01325 [Acidimicrobiales bacterium]|nr:hypothetical protein [Acidimicrobiales bacterium]
MPFVEAASVEAAFVEATFVVAAFLAGTVSADDDFFRSCPVAVVVVGAAAGEAPTVVVVTGGTCGAEVELSFVELPLGLGEDVKRTAPPTARITTRAEAPPTMARERLDGADEPFTIHAHHCLAFSMARPPSLKGDEHSSRRFGVRGRATTAPRRTGRTMQA